MNVHLIRIKLKSLQVFKNMLRFNHANIYLWFFIVFCFVGRSILGW